MSKRTAIKDLSCAAVGVTPVDRDWTTGYAESWEYYEAAECDQCGTPVIGTGEFRHSDIDPDSECDGYCNNDGPIISYSYALPRFRGDIQEAAKLISDLPLCLVKFMSEDDPCLALTGGGMDLTWEICEAYMRLGYLPPLHFCQLPQYAGKTLSSNARWIIAGCKASCRVVRGWANSKLRDLQNLRKCMNENK